MAGLTLKPGVLRVGSAVPDPPFEVERDGKVVGFDPSLMEALSAQMGLTLERVRFEGADFNDIFKGLADGRWDCVASGTTITPERARVADFCEAYLVSGQSLVCNVERTPQVRSIDDLADLVIAVQRGNTSEPVAERLRAERKVADVRLYAYGGIGQMLDDLDAGRIGAVMKLGPVMHWLVRERPALRVVQEMITTESLAICVRRGNDGLRAALDNAQARLRGDGTLDRIRKEWIGT